MQATPVVELCRASEAERPILYELLDHYLAELSSHREHAVGPVDAGGYEYFPLYWSEPGRHPLFLVVGTERVGFALLREVSDAGTIEMSEFYIRPEHRKSGLGSAAVAEIWRQYPGAWELQFHVLNRAASRFWPRCIGQGSLDKPVIGEVEEDDGSRIQYRFRIAAA
ncbi:MAG TPA: GNAT family N-acetyltransferase [Myxococcales bacterium]|nr:GNAT family N-acetyltransferase [Myxococcales bacterium]